MRILFIHRSFALVGGAERVIIDKANYLAQLGHEIILVSYEQGAHPVPYKLHSSVQIHDLDCRFFVLSKYPVFKRLFSFLITRQRFKKGLVQLISETEPQVVVLASDWQFLIKVVLDSAQLIPVISEFHNSYDFITKKIGNTGNGLRVRFTRYYYQSFLKYFKKCARLAVLTENDGLYWRKHSDNVVVIPNPVTLYPDSIDDIPKEEGRIICVARLNGQKRIDRLINAFSLIASKYPDWHVVVFGDGELRESLQNQIVQMNLSRQFFLNGPTKNIYDEYKKSQMLVLSSEYEGRPLALIEAMACGLPCVSFDCPSGPREIITPGVTGLLAKNGDVEELAAKIEWMITHEKERKSMGLKAREDSAKYRMSVVMKEWEKLYMGVN